MNNPNAQEPANAASVEDRDSTTDLARTVLRRLLDGNPPGEIEPKDLGEWHETVSAVRDAFDEGGSKKAREVFNSLATASPELIRLVSTSDSGSLKTTWTVKELYDMEFPEPQWAVQDIIPVGLSIMAGRPKVGKSWLALERQVPGFIFTTARHRGTI